LDEWFNAAKKGDVAALKEAHCSGTVVDVNSTSFPKFTALHFAAQHGHVEACNYLLQNGANIHFQDHHGRTPLHWAVESGNKELCQLLIKTYGANVNTTNEYGKGALAWAQTDDMKNFLLQCTKQ